MKLPRMRVAILALTALLALGVSESSACSVPVFRYALELWAPDPFQLSLFHKGELTEADQELVDRLNASSAANEINLRLALVDIAADMPPEALEVWESLGIEAESLNTPLLVLQTPSRRGPAATVLTLDLTAENVKQLFDSPARQEIISRILKGDSVVWVLLESGQAEKDDKALEVLTAQIIRLQGTLELPELAAEDVGSLSADAEPLKLAFSVLRVRRDDPAERTLVEMLLTVEPDLRDPEFVDQPMVFPMFGRGRALYALLGDGITPFTIEEAARYLTGACQCTVKAENPGADLLLAVDWDRFITPILQEKTEMPPLGGLASFAGMSDIEDSLTDIPSAISAPEEATDITQSQPQDSPEPIQEGPTLSAAPALDRESSGDLEPGASTSTSGNPSRLGMSALVVVSLLGAVVLVAGVVLTRRET